MFNRPRPTPDFRTIAACLALAAVTLAIYWPATRCEFVQLDDPAYVWENGAVRGGLSWPGVVWAFGINDQPNWHPLTWLSHMLDVQLFGLRAAAHHLVNVGLHVVNALLLFLVLLRLTGARWRCLFVAALFALHPLHVESVAWISERKDVLSTCFGLLALGAYAAYVNAKRTTQPATRFYLLALLLFAASLMSKPTLVTFPCLLLLLDYWPLQRLSLPLLQHSNTPTLRLLLEKLPFFVLSAASSVVTLVAQTHGGAVRTMDYLPLGARVANAAVGYVAYLQKAFWPVDLAVVYPLPAQRPAWQLPAAVLLLAALTFGAARAGRGRYWLVGWLWFLGLLVPMIGLVQVGDQAIADRYMYLPLVGLGLALTWGLGAWWPRGAGRGWALGAALLALLAALTARQVARWRNTETLMRHALAVTTNNYVAYDNLGAHYWERGRTAEAIECYRKSLDVHVRLESLNNLGVALASVGKHTEALALYEAALRQHPDEAGLRLNLADALLATGRTADALAQLEAVLRLRPDQPGIRNHLGLILTQTGRLDDAIAQYQLALRARPDDLQARNNLGIALTQAGRLDDAVAELQLVLRARPADLQARDNLGIALTQQGKLADAVAQFQHVLRLDTNHASAYVNLGNALAQQNKFPEALAAFRRYVSLAPTDVRGHQGLGRGLLELGQLDEAVIELRTVTILQPRDPDAHYRYGLALARLDRGPEARAQFEEALRLAPDHADARRQLDALAPAAKPVH